MIWFPRTGRFTSRESVSLIVSSSTLLSHAVTHEIREDEHSRNLSGVVSKEEPSYGGDYPEEDTFGTTLSAIDANRSGKSVLHRLMTDGVLTVFLDPFLRAFYLVCRVFDMTSKVTSSCLSVTIEAGNQ